MVATRQLTAGDLFAMDPGAGRFELVGGELREMSPAGAAHGAVGSRLTIRLGGFVEAKGLGHVFATETGFIITSEPDTVLVPDVAFVSNERMSRQSIGDGFVPFAPDLAIEIESPSNRTGELLAKVASYLAGGSREVWLVQPAHRSISRFRPAAPPETFAPGDVLAGGDLLPGFQLSVDDLFSILD